MGLPARVALIVSAVVAGGFLTLVGIGSWSRNHEEAKALGFASAIERRQAERDGHSDPAAWRAAKAIKDQKAAQERERDNLATSACVRAERAVKERLRAPSTAKFPNCWNYQTRISPDGTTVYVTGYVDAQNSFGAMLRNQFTVTLRRSPGASLGLEIVSATVQ